MYGVMKFVYFFGGFMAILAMLFYPWIDNRSGVVRQRMYASLVCAGMTLAILGMLGILFFAPMKQ